MNDLTISQAKRKRAAGATAIGPDSSLTEDGVALLFEAQHAGKLLFDHDIGAWFVWTGKRWQKETTQLAFEWARQVAREAAMLSEKDGKRTTAAKSGFVGGVERFCRSTRSFATTSAGWDKDPFLIGTPDGTVDLRNGRISEARQDQRITKLTAIGPATRADCPRWLRFLDEATKGDQEVIRFLQQACGYFLTGDTREHALFFIHGDGGNGKSVFVNTITKILGDYTVTAAMDTFTASLGNKHPTELARLHGARLVTASETEEGKAWNEQRIKELTGGDTITARFMRQDFFEFVPVLKLCIIGNHRPTLANVDDALKRRLNFVPFTNKPAVKDLKLEEHLRGEWPAILRWMIDGCLDWQKNGLIRPAAVSDDTERYFSDQDLMGQWLEDLCQVDVKDPTLWDRSAALFSSWKVYAEKSGERVSSTKSFADAMRKRGFSPQKRNGGVRAIGGVRLVENEARQ